MKRGYEAELSKMTATVGSKAEDWEKERRAMEQDNSNLQADNQRQQMVSVCPLGLAPLSAVRRLSAQSLWLSIFLLDIWKNFRCCCSTKCAPARPAQSVEQRCLMYVWKLELAALKFKCILKQILIQFDPIKWFSTQQEQDTYIGLDWNINVWRSLSKSVVIYILWNMCVFACL